jgi:hypothetical protein
LQNDNQESQSDSNSGDVMKHTAPRILALLFAACVPASDAQTTPPRKDIPAIAKAANGAIVTIITAAGDKPIAQGTGFVVSADGVIVTNYHVIKEGNVAIVKFPDGTILPVDGVLAADKPRDLAVIKIHGRTFRTLTLGNSDQIQVGEEVVAIGNPLGLELTVSNGILSGVRTDKEAGKFLQITAPFTHGSSGGPLFNMMGEVIGITTLVYEGAGDLNFAIPVNDAKRLLSNQSSKLQSLPNETEPVKAQTRKRTPPSTDALLIKEALQWMQDSSPYYGDGAHSKLTDFTGCHVHFTVEHDGYPEREDYSFNLSDIDPTSLGHFELYFGAGTTNHRRTVSDKIYKTEELTEFFRISFLSQSFGAQFEKAFRLAAELCGGKPSTF